MSVKNCNTLRRCYFIGHRSDNCLPLSEGKALNRWARCAFGNVHVLNLTWFFIMCQDHNLHYMWDLNKENRNTHKMNWDGQYESILIRAPPNIEVFWSEWIEREGGRQRPFLVPLLRLRRLIEQSNNKWRLTASEKYKMVKEEIPWTMFGYKIGNREVWIQIECKIPRSLS